jgi:hypothetical protein
VFDVAAMKLTGDDLVPELVVLADGAIYVATLDTATSQYGAAEVLLEQNGDGRIAAGDVNGDGLDDLAWTEGSDVHVFLGVVSAPLGGAVGDAVPAEEEGGE